MTKKKTPPSISWVDHEAWRLALRRARSPRSVAPRHAATPPTLPVDRSSFLPGSELPRPDKPAPTSWFPGTAPTDMPEPESRRESPHPFARPSVAPKMPTPDALASTDIRERATVMAPQLAEFASSSRFVVLVPRTGSLEEKVEGFLDWLDSQVRPSAAFVIAPNGETVAERRVDRDVSRLIPMLQRTLEVIEDDDDEPNRRVVFSLGRKGQLHFFEEKSPQGLLACGFVCTATLVDDAISQVRDSLLGSVGPSPLSLPAYDRPRAADLRVPRASSSSTHASGRSALIPIRTRRARAWSGRTAWCRCASRRAVTVTTNASRLGA